MIAIIVSTVQYFIALNNKASFFVCMITLNSVIGNKATSLIGPVILVPRMAAFMRFHCRALDLSNNLLAT